MLSEDLRVLRRRGTWGCEIPERGVEKEQETALARIAERFEDIKKRENQIPGEIADLTINVNNVSRSLEDAESELGEYDSIFEQIVRICEKYSHESTAAFTGVLRDEIRRDIDTTEADIATKSESLTVSKRKGKRQSQAICIYSRKSWLMWIQRD